MPCVESAALLRHLEGSTGRGNSTDRSATASGLRKRLRQVAASDSALKNLSSQQATELLRAGTALIADQLGNAFPNMLAPASEALGRLESNPGAVEARRLLGGERDELRRRFITGLKREQDELLGRLLRREAPAAAAGPRITADLLSLVDDDDASPDEVISKYSRKMRSSVDEQLRELALVTAFLAGRETVRPGEDPFGPEPCAKALLQAARDLRLEAPGWEPLLAALAKPITETLKGSYEALQQHFRKHKVDANEVRRELATRQVLGRPTVPHQPQGGTVAPAAPRPGWDEVPRAAGPMTVPGGPATIGGPPSGGGFQHTKAFQPTNVFAAPAPLAQEAMASLEGMLHNMSGVGPQVVLPAPGRPPSDLIDAISEMQRAGAQEPAFSPQTAALGPTTRGPTTMGGATTVQPGYAGGAAGPAQGLVPAPDQGAWRDVLLAKSTRTVDKLTIEIVGMLFEHVLHDNQVPAEIKAVLSRLQIPVLKVALTDADFFASNAHPARRLIDRLASTAVGWEPYGDENLRYKAEVERVVQQVLERFDKDLGTFEALLGEFESFLGEMPVRETDPLARARRALEDAERREVLVINTTIQVRRAFEHVELEPYLREFLVGPWVQALVSATMRDEETPGFSKSFRQVIHDVVWSVQPKVSQEERKRLVALIPTMTRVLRDGLALIRMGDPEQMAFLKQLMASHAVAVRPVDQATYIKSKVATGDLRQKLDDMNLTATDPLSTPGGGVHVSANAVRRAAEKFAASMVVAEPLELTQPMSIGQEADLDAQIAAWQRGSWFSLYDGEKTIKVKLRWISPLRTLFMFGAAEERNARVLSPETIKSYLRQGWLKPLEAEPLMKRAVDRVVSDLEQSPKREELVEKAAATGMTKARNTAMLDAGTMAPKLPS